MNVRRLAAVAVLSVMACAGGVACSDSDGGGDTSDRVEGDMPNDADDPATGAGGADSSGDGEGIGGAGGGAGEDSDEGGM